MAKEKKSAPTNGSPKFERPKGYNQASIELAGMWDPLQGPIHGRLIKAFRFTNRMKRETIVYILRLLEPCSGSAKGVNGGLEPASFERGEAVGVFHSGGLIELQNLYGCNVWVAPMLDAEGKFKTKDVPGGKMKLFEVAYSGSKRELPIDKREAREHEDEEKAERDAIVQAPLVEDIDDLGF